MSDINEIYKSKKNSKVLLLCVCFDSGPDLPPGISSLSSQLHVQSNQNTEDQHHRHSQHARWVHTVTAAWDQIWIWMEFIGIFFFLMTFPKLLCVCSKAWPSVWGPDCCWLLLQRFMEVRETLPNHFQVFFSLLIDSEFSHQSCRGFFLAAWSALVVPSCFPPCDWASNLHLVPSGCCITLCSRTLVTEMRSSLKAPLLFSHTGTAAAEQRGDLFKVSFQRRNIYALHLFFFPSSLQQAGSYNKSKSIHHTFWQDKLLVPNKNWQKRV